jgi:hypothetical protein
MKNRKEFYRAVGRKIPYHITRPNFNMEPYAIKVPNFEQQVIGKQDDLN